LFTISGFYGITLDFFAYVWYNVISLRNLLIIEVATTIKNRIISDTNHFLYLFLIYMCVLVTRQLFFYGGRGEPPETF
jgi:hypothetical protein